jgi:hypothetical protein
MDEFPKPKHVLRAHGGMRAEEYAGLAVILRITWQSWETVRGGHAH